MVSIGNFDGVHIGHSHLVERLRRLACGEGVGTVAFTFDPHPVRVLQPEVPFEPLTWTERKAALLHECGIDEVIVVHTTEQLLQQSSQEFFDQVVLDSLKPWGLVEGPNFRFGKGRTGSARTLKRLCAMHDIRLEVVVPQQMTNEIVSSSRIRSSLLKGRVDVAAQLLGRVHRLRGKVGSGAGRGTGIGFPTANLAECEAFLPKDGVYAGTSLIAGTCYVVALNIGPNPTFGETARKIEAHLIGFSGNLLGQIVEVDLMARIRDLITFSGADELSQQIQLDIEKAGRLAETPI